MGARRVCGGVAALAVLALAWPGGAAETAKPPGAEPAKPAGADPAKAAGADQALRSIEGLNQGLLGIMQHAKQLGFSGRLDQIRPVIAARYDFPFMAQKSVGAAWQQLGEAERARLVDALSRLAIATYAARFDGYDGERFETLGVDDGGYGTLLVHSRIVEKDGQATPLDYRLRQVDGQWQIIDVLLNGTVSELALRRADWSAVLKRDGFDALIKALDKKISDQEQGKRET